MQTIKLGIESQIQFGTKENPIFVNSLESLMSVKTDSYVQFICRNCGSKVVKQKPHSKLRLERFSTFLCKECSVRKTSMQKYGVEHYTKAESVKEKCQNTVYEKFGTKNVSQSEAIKEKIKSSNIKKFGVSSYSKTDEFKEKIRNTCLDKFGVDNYSKTTEFKQFITSLKNSEQFKEKLPIIISKMKETNNKNYGVDFPMQLHSEIEKRENNNLAIYGTRHFRKPKYLFENIKFDSSWELAFYVYHIKNNINIIREPSPISYEYNGQNHYYYPDFEVNGQLYEIKGDQFFRKNGVMYNPYNEKNNDIFNAKYNCALSNNVVFIRGKEIKFYLDFMKSEFGKDWKEMFLCKS